MREPPAMRAAIVLLASLLAVAPAAARPAPQEEGPSELVSEVLFIVKVTGDGSDVRLEVPLPQSDAHQEILDEDFRLRGFHMEEAVRDGNRFAVLTYPKLQGRKRFTYKARVRTRARRYDVQSPPLGTPVPRALGRWTIPTPRIQSRSPLVREALVRQLEPRLEAGEKDIVQLVYGLVSRQFERRTGRSGTPSVLKAIRTGAADDLGLERLFVTFLRASGVPARTVGGFELERTGKRKFARWSEVWLSGHWVPFSVSDGWYGRIRAPFLELYRGDRRLVDREGVAGIRFKVIVRDPRPDPVEPTSATASADRKGIAP